MARRYLDNAGLFDPVSPFDMYDLAGTYTYSSPDEVVRTDSTTTKATRTVTRPRRTTKKRRNNTGSNIIRNHDSVWDYKIQDGKLLTRRKTSDGNWIDITNNEEAKQRIEQFTGRSIGSKQSTSNNSAQSSKPASTTKPSNSSQSQPSRPASTPQTQQTARPAATQPSRQQAARQDSIRRDTTAIPQSRSLATTRGSNTEPDWQNMTDAEVQAYFSNSPLGGVTKTGRGNPNKKTQLLSDADLRANGWHWSNGQDFADAPTTDYNLLESARAKADNDNILLDSNGAVVPTSAVNRYINRGRVPLSISDYDAQFYQSQSENGTLRDVRRAQDVRRNQAFDRQRNLALGTMFGLPTLIASGITAPLATLGAVGGGYLASEGMDAIARANGRPSWAQYIGGNDPTAQFYASYINPFGILGAVAGGSAGQAMQPAASRVISPVVNKATGYLANRFGNIFAKTPYNAAYPSLAATEETEASMALARAMEDALNPRGTTKQLARAMNRSLKNKDLVRREQQMLAEDVPYLFDPEMTSSTYYYPLNPAMPARPMGPYGIPNHVNGVPFGTPVPRVLGSLPESGTTWALPVRPNSSLQPMPDAFGYYGAPYRRPVQVVQAEQPRVVVKGSAKKQYPKSKNNRKKK